MSYITIRKSAEKRAMKLLNNAIDADVRIPDDELREELHAIILAATEHDEVLVAEG